METKARNGKIPNYLICPLFNYLPFTVAHTIEFSRFFMFPIKHKEKHNIYIWLYGSLMMWIQDKSSLTTRINNIGKTFKFYMNFKEL